MAALLALMCLLSACGRELSHVTLIRVLGVEEAAGAVTLTALPGGDAPSAQTGRGETLSAAVEDLKGAGDTRLELTHVTAVVAGEVENLPDLLWQQVNHRKSGYGATLWLAGEGTAAELLAGAEDPAARLRSLEENAGVVAPTILEALRALCQRGQVTLPVLGREGNTLCLTGWRTVLAGEGFQGERD